MTAPQRDTPQGGQATAESSLAKALRLLPIVAARNAGGVNLSGVARKAGLNTATARRLLQGLVDGGLLSFDPYSKLYFLGNEFVRLSQLAGLCPAFETLRHDMHECLARVAELTQDSAYLSVISNGEALCIARETGGFPISVNTLDVGARRPLGVGAGSLALLAGGFDAAARQAIIARNAHRYPRYGRLTEEAVKRALGRWEKTGYVFNNSLIIDGVSAVGLPVFDQDGALVCAVSVGTINARMRPERRAEVAGIIRSAVTAIGYETDRTSDVSHSFL